MEWEVTNDADEDVLPYPLVVPYSTVDVEASFVVQAIVAVVNDVDEATDVIVGAVVSAP